MKFLRILTLGLAVLTLTTAYAAGNKKADAKKTVLHMVDPDATPETKALYANLWEIQKKGVMFGHHDYPSYGVGWRGDAGRSDVKDIVGDHPAVYSLDMAGINDKKIELVKEAHKRGGLSMLVWHQTNPLTEGPGKKYPVGTAWDNTKVVDQILTEGSEMNIKYKKRLDGVAEVFKKMVDENGKPIPVIFRPLHEHTQAWNWWGSKATTEDEFINFWRFIVSYLRDTKQVHNVIYAISPQMDEVYSDPKARLMFRWPGDQWVDLLGMDCYHGLNTPAFVSNMKALSQLSSELGKPVGVTETGLEKKHKADYWTVDLLPAMKGNPCSMVVAWRNDNPNHAFGPYPSDATAEDFKEFYKDCYTLFEKDLPNMYTMPKEYTPVNPKASKEAKQLLEFLYSIQGKYTLTGQHNFVSGLERYDDVVFDMTGKYPVVWGSDFSFNAQGDNIREYHHCGPMNLTTPWGDCKVNDRTTKELRQGLVDEIKLKYKEGRIITLMWHCCFPSEGDNCNGSSIWTWNNRPSQEVWKELVTDGTTLNTQWKKQMDGVAKYLKQLRDAKIPVLWRPYHEMNGVWFWWCNKPGDDGFKKLWIMTYDYLVKHHKLNNLLWVWNTNAPRNIPGDEAGPYEDFFPGTDYVDVLAADVYKRDYKSSHHDDLLKVGNGKLITLGEVGQLPTVEQYESQAYWSWFMVWGYFIQSNKGDDAVKAIYNNPRSLTLDKIDFSGKTYKVKQ